MKTIEIPRLLVVLTMLYLFVVGLWFFVSGICHLTADGSDVIMGVTCLINIIPLSLYVATK